MSDSHGDVVKTRRAVELLTERGATKFFHCGDLCSDGVLAELAGLNCTFVWGNCDLPTAATQRFVESLDLEWPEMPVRVSVGGKRIAVYHGHEDDFPPDQESPTLDYVFYGHTHRLADRREDGIRFINPGALYRAAVHTVALLNLERDELKFLSVPDGEELKLKR